MTMLFVDGFDHYISSDILKKWSGVITSAPIITSGGRRTTNCMQIYSNTGVYKNLPVACASNVVGMAVKFEDILGYPFLALRDNGTVQLDFLVNSNGSISVRRGSSTVLGTTAIGLVSVGSYYHIQAKVVYHASAGSVVLKVNDSEVLNLTGINTKQTSNATADQLALQSSAGAHTDFDDVYICDLLGSVNNDFLGDCRIDTLFPTSDGHYAQFTPSTGTDHYALVDETAPNTTDYNSDATVGHRDSYGYSNLESLTTQNIYGVQICNASTKSDAGAKSVANFCRSGTTDADSAAMVMTATSQLYYLSIQETDPNTSAAWTESGVNSAEFGVKVAA